MSVFPSLWLLLSLLAPLVPLVSAGKGFLFICTGDCDWWQYLLMVVSILICICCLCGCCVKLCSCCSTKDEETEELEAPDHRMIKKKEYRMNYV